MKKMFWAVSLATVTLISCKKEKEEAPNTKAELILGTWSHTNHKTDKLVGGVVVDTENDATLAGETIRFTEDGRITSFGETASYKVDGNQLIFYYGDDDTGTTEIIVLTETNLEYYSIEPYSWDDTTYIETVQFKK